MSSYHVAIRRLAELISSRIDTCVRDPRNQRRILAEGRRTLGPTAAIRLESENPSSFEGAVVRFVSAQTFLRNHDEHEYQRRNALYEQIEPTLDPDRRQLIKDLTSLFE